MKVLVPAAGQTAAARVTTLGHQVNNLLGRTGRDRDYLYVTENRRAFSGVLARMHWNPAAGALEMSNVRGRLPQTARYTSPVIKCRFPATEFLPSWNIALGSSATQCFRILLRVGDASGKMSPWFFMGEGGICDLSVVGRTEANGWGKTHIDYLELFKPAHSFQYRVDFTASANGTGEAPRLHRIFVHYSGQGGQFKPYVPAGSPPTKLVRVKVPYRSQLDVEVEELRHYICCPTCVSMVLEQYGIKKPTLEVCEAAYDKRHDMHGIWPRASQVAFEHGFRAWVDRFRTIDDVRAWLDTGRAIIASIRVGEDELRGARYRKSNGHLIVITGLKKNKVLVNDPYSAGPKGAEIEYESEDIEKVWLDRGGVAILIEDTN